MRRHLCCILTILLLSLFLAAEASAAGSGKVRMSTRKLTLIEYETTKLTLENAPGKVKWSTTNPSVATVSRKGKVTAVAAGSCRIIAKCGKKKYSCKIKVKALALNAASLTLVRGRQWMLAFNNEELVPAYASSNAAVATVDGDGRIQALMPGKCTVTAVYRGKTYSCSVTVLWISPDALKAQYQPLKSYQGRILLAGSSSADLWYEAPQAFEPYELVNMAIGGTTVINWQEWHVNLITSYKPSAVVLYAGANDLGGGEKISGALNAKNTIRLLKSLRKKLKDVPIYYVSICPCPVREGAIREIAASNMMVQQYCRKAYNLTYIDVTKKFVMADGRPNPALFLPDRVHPNSTGYRIWSKLVAKTVKRDLRVNS